MLLQANNARSNRYKTPSSAKDRQIAQLQAKLTDKNEVIAELLEEHVALKKGLWEL